MPFMQNPLARLLVLLDYDGTVTAHECNDLVLQNLTGDAWREPEAALQRGLIGHAECFSRQVAMVNVPREQYIAQVVDAAELAPGFDEFLRALHEAGARTAVVSAGFREAIEAVWRRNALPPVERLRQRAGRASSRRIASSSTRRWATAPSAAPAPARAPWPARCAGRATCWPSSATHTLTSVWPGRPT